MTRIVFFPSLRRCTSGHHTNSPCGEPLRVLPFPDCRKSHLGAVLVCPKCDRP